jgi:UDP-N-acetyl-D-mannosaminuronate dehydrogenase
MNEKVLVIGIGEIGGPLLELIRPHYETYSLDIKPGGRIPPCDIVHICFPFEEKNFVEESVRYLGMYRPELTIINSTVAPGTTRQIASASGRAVVNSPVRGKHAKMKQDLLHYTKFIGGLEESAVLRAAKHFQSVGLRTRVLGSPEATELAKLTETTYFGLLIAWAQEVERYSNQLGAEYGDVISFYEEIPFLPPVKYFPGVIGGHCVMPNIKILKRSFESTILHAIELSNELKRKQSEALAHNG